MPIVWRCEGGEAWAADDDRVVWHGSVGIGTVVLQALPVPASDDGIVVLDWSYRPSEVLPWHPYENLARVTSAGDLVWRCAPPASETLGCWTKAGFVDDRLVVQGWQSECDVDAATGAVLACRFTK
jgi:hypothetical protein